MYTEDFDKFKVGDQFRIVHVERMNFLFELSFTLQVSTGTSIAVHSRDMQSVMLKDFLTPNTGQVVVSNPILAFQVDVLTSNHKLCNSQPSNVHVVTNPRCYLLAELPS